MTEANSINAATTGIVGNTGTAFTGTAVTAHAVIIGGSTSSTLANASPSATSGVPVISQGASADPIFGTAVVAGGGTGSVTFTAYGPVVAASTTTGALTSVTPSATSGVPFISQGSSANPAFGTAVVAGGGTGAVTLTGLLTGNGTSAVTATAITQYNVITGGASNAPNSVAPSATSGVPVISQGSSSQPIFGTALVAGGGTGATTFNTNGAMISGTSGTAALAAVALASQQFLVGNTSAAPTAKTLSVVIQTFTSSGTYTPTTGMVYCITEAVGSGGGGGGSANSTTSFICAGGGGGGGGYARKISTAAAIGASQTVTIGNAGAAGTAGNNPGGNGADCSLGSICIAKGGTGGNGCAGASGTAAGGAGGVAGTGDFTFPGQAGSASASVGNATATLLTPPGGNSFFGFGGNSLLVQVANVTGSAGSLYGGGGGGGSSWNAGGTQAGAIGAKGIVIVTEFVLA